MKEHPILFSGPMVRAILDGSKTQTHRPMKIQNGASRMAEFHHIDVIGSAVFTDGSVVYCPFGKVGDRLWVRETFFECIDNNDRIRYAADGAPPVSGTRHYKKRPSIFMPRSACRIILEITRVRIERVHKISFEDTKKDGVSEWIMWDKRYPGSWDRNDWVWMIEFRHLQNR